jgi:hypothetical protein
MTKPYSEDLRTRGRGELPRETRIALPAHRLGRHAPVRRNEIGEMQFEQ